MPPLPHAAIAAALAKAGGDVARAMKAVDRKGIPYLSFSKLSDLEFCEYRYELAYVQGVKPEEEPAYFAKGHLFHAAAAGVYRALAARREPDRAGLHRMIDRGARGAEDRAHLRNALQLLIDNAFSDWDVLGVEEPFVLPLDGLPPLVGVIDLVLRRGATVAVVDHKTGRTFGEPDPIQLALYREHARRAHGAREVRAMFDQYRWVNDLGRARKPAFQRSEVTLGSWEDAFRRLRKGHGRMAEIEKGGRATAEGECFRCPLRPVCDRAKRGWS